MKIVVSETTDIQLEWLVAKCEGHDVVITTIAEQAERFNNALLQYGEKPSLEAVAAVIAGLKPRLKHGVHLVPVPSYLTDWAQGGPIIERKHIHIGPRTYGPATVIMNSWRAIIGFDPDGGEHLFEQDGPTPLIAAMRVYVVSELGEEVDVPEELA